jgi:hypothetical protein
MTTFCYPDGTDWSCRDDIDELDPDKKARAEELAWMTLGVLTANRIATCPIELRPCGQRRRWPTWVQAVVSDAYFSQVSSFNPVLFEGSWYNLTCGCDTACDCIKVSEIPLPPDTGDIASVQIGSQTLDPSSYRIDNGNRLVRTDGGVWPLWQDMSAEPGDEGTFVVTYYQGATPTQTTLFAAGLLASEFYDDLCGNGCRLPYNTTTVARGGITIDVTKDMFEDGKTGIPAVDAVISYYNPFKLKARPRVLSPDRRGSRITTRRFS